MADLPQPDYSRLLATLNNATIQDKNNALFQTIKNLIAAVMQSQKNFANNLNGIIAVISGGGGGIPGIINATYLTATNQTPILPLSRQLLAGTNVTFDDTVAGERTINVAASGEQIHPFLLMGG